MTIVPLVSPIINDLVDCLCLVTKYATSNNEAAAKKFANGPIGSPILNKNVSKFFINSTINPANGPNVNVANSPGTSLISKVKYGGKKGIGNFKKVKINATALNILIVINFF